MRHIYVDNDASRTLLLLHGTGGNENSLLQLAEIIDPSANVLSLRGDVLENGMPRFFKRLTEGVFDEVDLVKRTHALNAYLDDAAKTYGFDRKQVVAVGYSNGANIAASLMFHDGEALHGAILHHPMMPLRGITLPDLSDKQVFLAAGRNDHMCPAKESAEIKEVLEAAGASVTIHWEDNGHSLTQSEIVAAAQWYRKTF